MNISGTYINGQNDKSFAQTSQGDSGVSDSSALPNQMGWLSWACGFCQDTLLAQDKAKWVTKVCQIQEGKLATQTVPFTLEQYKWPLPSSDGSHLLIASQHQLHQQIQLWTGKLSLKNSWGCLGFFLMYWLHNNKRFLSQATYSQAGHKSPCWNCL